MDAVNRRQVYVVAVLAALAVAGSLAAPPSSAAAGPWHRVLAEPAEREAPGLVYDAAIGKAVLVGGDRGTYAMTPDAWTWDRNGWRKGPAAPPARINGSIAYDPAARRVVLYGGWGVYATTTDPLFGTVPSYGYLADTWTFDGTRWSQVGGAGPPAREHANLAYDPATGQVVLFGGAGCSGGDRTCNQEVNLRDTWTFDGRRWTRRALGGPAARGDDAATVYDPATRQLLLVGGGDVYSPGMSGAFGGVNLGDTWIWDGRRWSKSISELPGRHHSSLAYDPATRQVLLFGGDHLGTGGASPTYLADSWTWNGRRWSQVRGASLIAGPPPRTQAAATWDPRSARVVLFGGRNANGALGDTWLWDGSRWVRGPGGPRARYAAGMVYDPAASTLLLFGGAGRTDYLGDTWTWDGARWSQHSGPAGRYGAVMAFDPASRQVVLFGGCSNGCPWQPLGFALHDTWTWNGSHWSESTAAGPPARVNSSLVYDAATRQLLLFGGITNYPYGGPYLGDTWAWSGTRWTQVRGPGPSPRENATLVYDAASRQVLLYGGDDGSGTLADTWTFSGGRWSRFSGSGPGARTGYAIAYDPAKSQVVLFGGQSGNVFFGDTWTWNGSAWTQVVPLSTANPSAAVSGPTPRNGSSLAYDGASRQLVLFGGQDAGLRYLGDTWTWDGQVWTRRSTSGPPGRYHAGLVYDAAAGRLLLAAGFGATGGVLETSVPAPTALVGRSYYLSDAWTWDGRSWRQVSAAGPASVAGYDLRPALVYDDAAGQAVFFEGTSATQVPGVRETWTW